MLFKNNEGLIVSFSGFIRFHKPIDAAGRRVRFAKRETILFVGQV